MNYFSTPFSRLESFQIRIEQLFLFELTELLIQSSAFQLQYMVMTYETNMALPHKSQFTCLLRKKIKKHYFTLLASWTSCWISVKLGSKLGSNALEHWTQSQSVKLYAFLNLNTTKIKWKLTQITHRSLPS